MRKWENEKWPEAFLVKQAIVNCYLLIVNSQHLGPCDAIRDGGGYAVGPCDACAEWCIVRSRPWADNDWFSRNTWRAISVRRTRLKNAFLLKDERFGCRNNHHGCRDDAILRCGNTLRAVRMHGTKFMRSPQAETMRSSDAAQISPTAFGMLAKTEEVFWWPSECFLLV